MDNSTAGIMFGDFNTELAHGLESLREEGLYRELRRIDSPQSPRLVVGGEPLLNFSSNDYLGLANEPRLKAAAHEAIERYGAGTGASRLICGSLAPHHELEEALANFKGVEAALSFSTGYAAALGGICALIGKDDVIILDKLVHACIVDAARLSGAKLRVFAHNDLNDLEAILRWARTRESRPADSNRVLIVTESVFSMDGDQAPLREMVELKDKYGAWLMVDEAHATGLYGANRRGLAEALGISERVEVQMGTLGKALGASGGYICGSRSLVDCLVNRGRTFIFSTAPVPAAAAAATAGIRFVQSPGGTERTATLWQRHGQLTTNLNIQPSQFPSAILPLIIGEETRAVETAGDLRSRGVFVPAVRYPAVARGSARLRLTLSAAHSEGDIECLLSALRSANLTASKRNS
jgi:8-amino-7-oxononanoate synthase